jgi:arylsulfatase A-like enzyme
MKVLVITAAGLRPDFLGCYGCEWVETPRFDRLAAEGIVADWHFANDLHPARSRYAWRTGRFPSPVPGGSADLLAILRQQSVATALVIDGSQSCPPEFAQGWSDLVMVPPTADEGTPLERSLEAAVDLLDRLAAHDSWLLWIELATMMPPWQVPSSFLGRYFQDFDEGEACVVPSAHPPVGDVLDPNDDAAYSQLQRSYAGVVAYLDEGLGLLVDELQNRDMFDDLAIIITADRGLSLGEHGPVGVTTSLHEESWHVPLLLRLPAASQSGQRLTSLTAAFDLMPTLLDLFGCTAPLGLDGVSLLPLLDNRSDQHRESVVGSLTLGQEECWALRTAKWSLQLPADGNAQLYVKPDDRWEVNDVAQHHHELAEEFAQRLRRCAARGLDGHGPTSNVDD